MFAGGKSTIQERKYASIKRYDDTAYISKLSNLYSSILKPTKLSLAYKTYVQNRFHGYQLLQFFWNDEIPRFKIPQKGRRQEDLFTKTT